MQLTFKKLSPFEYCSTKEYPQLPEKTIKILLPLQLNLCEPNFLHIFHLKQPSV